MALIFVYGSLKTGKSNHGFLSGQRLVGQAATKPLYRLYLLEGYPGMVPAEPGVSVSGEIWEVDQVTLVRLDRLEGTAEGLYERAQVSLEAISSHLSVETYLYLRSVEGRIDLGSRYDG